MTDAPLLRAFDLARELGDDWPRFQEPVYFVAKDLRRAWPELDGPEAWIDPLDVHARRWGPGESIWVVSSYLKLKARGLDVRIVDRLVPDAVNVAYLDDVLRHPHAARAFVVAALGDRWYLRWGELAFVQSPVLARAARTCLLDMWPQPGLTPRDTARGGRVERIGYMGPEYNLAAAFRAPEFRRHLEDRGVELALRLEPATWHDFADVDLTLAVRDISPAWVRTKPSTKLVHAWLTGSPALLGPEPSYRYWGRDGTDYFEVREPACVLRVIDALRADPDLYGRVVAAGREAAVGHDEDGVCRQWAAALAGPVREAFEAWREDGAGTCTRHRMRRRFQARFAPLSRKLFMLRVRGLEAVTARAKARR